MISSFGEGQSQCTTMRVLASFAFFLTVLERGSSFQSSGLGAVSHHHAVFVRPPRRNAFLASLNANRRETDDDFDELIPETSFGAEAVPEAQRPVNEYLDVTQQPFFGWADLDSGSKGLLTRLVTLYSVVFFSICYPIAGATFTQEGYLIQKITASNVGAVMLVFFLLVRLYTGWGYLGDRLTSKVIEYEETGWYDGNYELKTETEQKRDKFLYMSKVKPVVERLKLFTYSTGGIFVASIIAFNVANSMKPVFDEYDPSMLERLRYDDKLADKAATNSYGKPTYCDSRYYRAVAGGSGCN